MNTVPGVLLSAAGRAMMQSWLWVGPSCRYVPAKAPVQEPMLRMQLGVDSATALLRRCRHWSVRAGTAASCAHASRHLLETLALQLPGSTADACLFVSSQLGSI